MYLAVCKKLLWGCRSPEQSLGGTWERSGEGLWGWGGSFWNRGNHRQTTDTWIHSLPSKRAWQKGRLLLITHQRETLSSGAFRWTFGVREVREGHCTAGGLAGLAQMARHQTNRTAEKQTNGKVLCVHRLTITTSFQQPLTGLIQKIRNLLVLWNWGRWSFMASFKHKPSYVIYFPYCHLIPWKDKTIFDTCANFASQPGPGRSLGQNYKKLKNKTISLRSCYQLTVTMLTCWWLAGIRFTKFIISCSLAVNT